MVKNSNMFSKHFSYRHRHRHTDETETKIRSNCIAMWTEGLSRGKNCPFANPLIMLIMQFVKYVQTLFCFNLKNTHKDN